MWSFALLSLVWSRGFQYFVFFEYCVAFAIYWFGQRRDLYTRTIIPFEFISDRFLTEDGAGSYWGEYLYLAQFASDSGDKESPLNGSASRRNGQNYPCLKCGRWYSTKSIMLRHMNHECGVEKKIQCTICLKRFRRKWNLEQHIKRLHPVWVPRGGITCQSSPYN